MPLFLLSFLSGAKSFFSAILTFCSKPPGSYLAIAAACVIALWWFGQHEFNAGEAKCNAAHKAAVQTEVARQTAVNTAVVAKSEVATTASATQDQSNRIKVIHVKALAAALPPPRAVCPDPVPGALADGLRALH